MNERQKKIAALCDGVKTSKQIAEICGDNQKYVQRTMLKFDLSRRKIGAQPGADNHAYKAGRMIDRDGYVLVTATLCHPYARQRKGRNHAVMLEHRLVMERKLGRHLLPSETVDHIDGLRLHNAPSNLRLFHSNAEHLKATITGQTPKWSQEGIYRMNSSRTQRKETRQVHKYNQMKKCGDARLIQILRAALKLGIDSPFLLGTHHLLEKAGILDFSHPSLKRALDDLYQKYE
jgi:hypothetical protein